MDVGRYIIFPREYNEPDQWRIHPRVLLPLHLHKCDCSLCYIDFVAMVAMQ